MPEAGRLGTGSVVYVENDGRCAPGEVIKVTAGSRKKGIERTYVCVPRPEE